MLAQGKTHHKDADKVAGMLEENQDKLRKEQAKLRELEEEHRWLSQDANKLAKRNNRIAHKADKPKKHKNKFKDVHCKCGTLMQWKRGQHGVHAGKLYMICPHFSLNFYKVNGVQKYIHLHDMKVMETDQEQDFLADHESVSGSRTSGYQKSGSGSFSNLQSPGRP